MKKGNSKEKFFTVASGRSLMCFCLTVFLFTVTGIRVFEITAGKSNLYAQNADSLRREKLARIRGTVYDCNMTPITNNKKTLYAAVPPTSDAVASVEAYLSGVEKDEAVKRLAERKVAVCRPFKEVNNDSVATSEVYTTDYDGFLFEHIVGYVGKDGHGECGIEAAYDGLLYSDSYAAAVYRVSGTGFALLGEKPEFENDLQSVRNGVVTTLDIRLQEIAAAAAQGLKKGAVVIADARTGKIRALVSKPSFSPDALSLAVNDGDSPLIDRALLPFSVGSVFKPCIAAAVIDKGLEATVFTCTGKCLIDGRYFSCHQRDGHGTVGLKDALTYSCNSYFYNIGILLGSEAIRKCALLCSFGTPFHICDGIAVEGGNLTKPRELKSNSGIANYSIGQGDILLSPVGMLTLYSAIATDGRYYIPSIVESTVKNGKETKYGIGNPSRAMSEKAARLIRHALREVVVSGTAKQANSATVEICGKTATAQTGRYTADNTEITNSWFCGFFPFEQPRYVGVVMSDGASDLSPSLIFKEIAEKITETMK